MFEDRLRSPNTRFRLSKTNTVFECKFSDATYEANVKLKIDTQVIPQSRSFKYLGVSSGQELAHPGDESSENEDVEINVLREIGLGTKFGTRWEWSPWWER
ncbi:hypothetical protein H5410_049911 [Solanum commersonii]|uniref:Uncharacterized protein n=1 Tax=Solanum commersonii TaxID=4109 RepID=A0A9J5WW23_SOLCO|nr:hypothetical protein H5410_049911 [Solanum commersonii]